MLELAEVIVELQAMAATLDDQRAEALRKRVSELMELMVVVE